MRRPRILVGAMLHETNTFNLVPTRLGDFEGRYLCLDAATIRDRLAGTATEIGGFLEAAETRDWDVELAVAAAAGPSGPLDDADWHQLSARLTGANGPFDGVLLALHGAMVTATDRDPEGTLLSALRAIHGPRVPIVATLDMHANLSARMVAAADAMLPYETYPHVDHAACALRAAGVLARLMQAPAPPPGTPGGRLTRSALLRPPLLDAADHGRTDPPGPMNELLARTRALRQLPGVVAAGLVIGFPWADVADAGPAVLVTVDASATPEPATPDPAALGLPLAQALWDSRERTQLVFPSAEEAMTLALQGQPGDRPLVLADFADNPSGGAYGDSPNLLRAMLAAGLQNAAFAALADPDAVRAARAAGEGAVLDLTLGGRQAPDLTPPLSVTARVLRLHDGGFRCAGPMLRGVEVQMGPSALLEVSGIKVVVASRALAVTDVNLFHTLGIDPAGLTTLALKSRNHHRAAFGPLARQVLLVDAGGIATMKLDTIDYRNLPRPIWPLDPGTRPDAIRILEFHRNVDHAQ